MINLHYVLKLTHPRRNWYEGAIEIVFNLESCDLIMLVLLKSGGLDGCCEC